LNTQWLILQAGFCRPRRWHELIHFPVNKFPEGIHRSAEHEPLAFNFFIRGLTANQAGWKMKHRRAMKPYSLSPFTLAGEATRLMDTDCCPATRACPLGLFAPDKILYPGSANGLEVLDHAHPVFCPVTLVKMCQQFAWKA
jgi:hypothetical protein